MKTIKLRKAISQDCDDLFGWLNDKNTRKASFNSDIVSYRTHKCWFVNSLTNHSRFIYVGENKKGEKIGVVRVDIINKNVAEYDINLNPKMRGRGYGAELIAQTYRQFAKEWAVQFLIARAKKKNVASVKVFIKSGFIEIFEYNDAKFGKIVVLGLAMSRRI